MEYKLAMIVASAVVGGLLLGNITTGLFTAPILYGNIDEDKSSETGGMRMYGKVQYTLMDPDGNLVYDETYHNRIVDGGEGILADVFDGSTVNAVDNICVGTGSTGAGDITDATPKQATLETPVTGGGSLDVCKLDGTVTDQGQTNDTPRTIEIDQTWTGGTDFGAGTNVSEAVLSDTDAVGAPTLAQTFSRQTFTGITVNANDTLTIKWIITIQEDACGSVCN